MPYLLIIASNAPLDVSPREGVGPQVNKFEQVPSDDHQMSVAAPLGADPGDPGA